MFQKTKCFRSDYSYFFAHFFNQVLNSYFKQLLHIKKHEVYLIENQKQRGTNLKVIESYIQCTLFKTRSEQIEQMSFSFFSFFRLIRHWKCNNKLFSID